MYKWRGIDKTLKLQSGIIYAKQRDIAVNILKKQEIIPCQIRTYLPLLHLRRLNYGNLAIFCQRMLILLSFGINLLQALSLITHKSLQIHIILLQQDLLMGENLDQVFHKYHKQFGRIFCNFVSIGALTGRLDLSFKNLLAYYNMMLKINRNLKRLLLYPSIVFITMIIMIFTVFLYIIPEFANLFASFNGTLPQYTQILLNTAVILQTHKFFIFSMISVQILAAIVFKDNLIFKLPILGKIWHKIMLSNLLSTLSISMQVGLPIMQALDAAILSISYKKYQKAIIKIQKLINQGDNLSQAFMHTKLFPHDMTEVIAIGEACGNLAEMLGTLAENYILEITYAIDGLHAKLEPIIMLSLGSCIGFVVISMYLPMLKLGTLI
jgi:type II secretory pathway component PulF